MHLRIVVMQGWWPVWAAAVAVFPSPASAQTRFLTETRLNLRRDPSTAHPPIRVLRAGDSLFQVAVEPVSNGFVRVHTTRPDTGWVALDFI